MSARERNRSTPPSDSGAVQAILAAFQFLSRFPVRKELDFTPELLRRSAGYYPLVGAAIGLCVWGFGLLAAWLVPPLPVAVLALILWVWLTGGLHLDGWMDTADGLLSYRSRESMLEIMKDSRVGAMGVLACVLLLMLKASLLASLLQGSALSSGLALLTAPVWSRWFMTRAMHKWPKARQGEGLAGQFRGFGDRDAQSATVLAISLSGAGLLLTLIIGPWSSIGEPDLLRTLLYLCLHPLLAWAAGTWAAGRMSAKLGGLTGDTYGALNEGLEALLLLLAVLILR
ncbi:adenosylcobinamide-GDP ribazoletransferase [Paenibacillus macerans]|uniref:adenosylcobinamide-GDP ribazoletransferase n=1 Tax=Paenibacillus macerans TaxID=44252 RepID=UPI003D32458F